MIQSPLMHLSMFVQSLQSDYKYYQAYFDNLNGQYTWKMVRME